MFCVVVIKMEIVVNFLYLRGYVLQGFFLIKLFVDLFEIYFGYCRLKFFLFDLGNSNGDFGFNIY